MMKKQIRPLMGHLNESGAVLVLFALSTVVLFGSMGLVHDFGLAYVENRQMQTSADAAALGGAYTLKRKDTANVVTHATEELTRNGFDGGTWAVNNPPQDGDFAGDDDFVEVILTKELQTYFGNFFEYGDLPNHDKVTVQTRAVAGLTGYGSGCIYVLAGRGEKAFHVSSGSRVESPDCDVMVSSCDRDGALYVDSGSSLEAQNIYVCGDYDDSGGFIDPEPKTGEACGTPRCSPGRDPLLYISPPSNANGSCDETDFKVSSRGSKNNRYSISPGVYCKGIMVESDSHVEFEPGIYILKGGGMRITSNSSAVGTGVGFYNTEGGGYDYEAIYIDSGSEAALYAPTTGEMEGMLFFQDRDVDGDYDNKIESNADVRLGGTLYFPTQHLMIHSNTIGNNEEDWSLIVANTLEVSSGSMLFMGADSTGGRPTTVKTVTLVEGKLY